MDGRMDRASLSLSLSVLFCPVSIDRRRVSNRRGKSLSQSTPFLPCTRCVFHPLLFRDMVEQSGGVGGRGGGGKVSREGCVRSVQTSAMFDVERQTGVLRSAFASDRYRAALVHDLPQPLDWTNRVPVLTRTLRGLPCPHSMPWPHLYPHCYLR